MADDGAPPEIAAMSFEAALAMNTRPATALHHSPQPMPTKPNYPAVLELDRSLIRGHAGGDDRSRSRQR